MAKQLSERSPKLDTSHLLISPKVILQKCSNQKNIYLVKNRHIDPWNTTESPEINLYVCNQLIFVRGAKSTQS